MLRFVCDPKIKEVKCIFFYLISLYGMYIYILFSKKIM